MPGFAKFMGGRQKCVNKVNLVKKHKKFDTSKTHFTVQNLIFPKKAIRKLKVEWTYEIKFPIGDRCENEISIEIHCAAGKILTKTGSRARIGICGFLENR